LTAVAPSSTNRQGFHARFSNSLNLIACSPIGGTATETALDMANAIALFGTWENAVIAGEASTTSLQVSAGALQRTIGSRRDAFLQTIATTTKPVSMTFSSLTPTLGTTNFAVITLNATVVNPSGQPVTLTITGNGKFVNSTQSISLTVPFGSKAISTKVFGDNAMAGDTVTVTGTGQGVSVNGSFTYN
jgi:hypothetical protein